MNPFVKCAMRAAFPTDETDPADPYVAALAVAATEETAEALRIQDADLPDAREQLADTITAKAEAAGSSKGMKLLMRAANKAVAKSEDRVRELEDRLWALDRDTAAAEAARMRADELPAAQSASAASAAAASPTQRGAEDSDESWQDGGSNLEARRPRAPPGQRRGRRGDFTRAVRHCGHRGRCEGGSGRCNPTAGPGRPPERRQQPLEGDQSRSDHGCNGEDQTGAAVAREVPRGLWHDGQLHARRRCASTPSPRPSRRFSQRSSCQSSGASSSGPRSS